MARRLIRVRMYHVGFGDCFLLTFPGPRHMLVDCGTLTPSRLDRLRLVAKDVAAVTAGHVQVVVVTHRHLDHIVGFARAADVWSGVRVDEVWLPWTEDPADAEAAAIRRRQEQVALALAEERPPADLALVLRNSSGSDGAMEVLLDGFAGLPTRSFLAAGPAEHVSKALPGLHVRVLSPPRTTATVKRMHAESLLALAGTESLDHGVGPFGKAWEVGESSARALFAEELRRRPPLEDDSAGAAHTLTFWLDKAINNTSLVLLLRFGRTRLLLPGDAQWDAWVPALAQRDLEADFRGVNLYKASHHGSQTGTPRRVIEALGRVATLVSTDASHWDTIPQLTLLERLRDHGPVARSDDGVPALGFQRSDLATDFLLTY